MQRALMWLNLYGRQAVRHKLKKALKRPFERNISNICFTDSADGHGKSTVLFLSTFFQILHHCHGSQILSGGAKVIHAKHLMFLALFWAYVGQPDGHIG